MPDTAPGNGFFGWLGRQVGHVKKAVKTDVTKPAPKPSPAAPGGVVGEPKVIYRTDAVEEAPHPADPNLKLRRTTIDEVIVEGKHEARSSKSETSPKHE